MEAHPDRGAQDFRLKRGKLEHIAKPGQPASERRRRGRLNGTLQFGDQGRELGPDFAPDVTLRQIEGLLIGLRA
jgi:hypothetical protein